MLDSSAVDSTWTEICSKRSKIAVIKLEVRKVIKNSKKCEITAIEKLLMAFLIDFVNFETGKNSIGQYVGGETRSYVLSLQE